MTAIVASPSIERRGFSPRTIRMIEAIVHPARRAARVGRALLDLPARARQIADRLLQPDLDRRLRLLLLHPEHAAARRAADPHRPGLRHSRAHRPDHDRRRGRAGARRLLRRGDRHPAGQRRLDADHRPADHGAVGDAGRRGLDRPRRLAPALSRRQRDHLLAASLLHRHRHHELLRRGRAARSRLGEQAVDHADRRRLPHRRDSRDIECIGALPRASCLPSCSTS